MIKFPVLLRKIGKNSIQPPAMSVAWGNNDDNKDEHSCDNESDFNESDDNDSNNQTQKKREKSVLQVSFIFLNGYWCENACLSACFQLHRGDGRILPPNQRDAMRK